MVPTPAVDIVPVLKLTPLLPAPVAVALATPVIAILPLPALIFETELTPYSLLPVPPPVPFRVMLPVPVSEMDPVWLIPLLDDPLELPPVPVIEIAPPLPASATVEETPKLLVPLPPVSPPVPVMLIAPPPVDWMPFATFQATP